jgi:hypothetical protein
MWILLYQTFTHISQTYQAMPFWKISTMCMYYAFAASMCVISKFLPGVNSEVCPVSGVIKSDSYLNGTVFRTITDIGLQQCVRECMLRSHCLSINYNSGQLFCELNWASSTSSTDGVGEREGFKQTDVNTWPRVSIHT